MHFCRILVKTCVGTQDVCAGRPESIPLFVAAPAMPGALPSAGSRGSPDCAADQQTPVSTTCMACQAPGRIAQQDCDCPAVTQFTERRSR